MAAKYARLWNALLVTRDLRGHDGAGAAGAVAGDEKRAAAAERAFEVKRFCEVRHRSGCEKGDEDDSWWQLHAVFETLAEQLHWGVMVELEPLMRGGLGAMDIDVAAALYKGGIRKVDDLAHATAKKLQEVLSKHGSGKMSRRRLEAVANSLFLEARERLTFELEEKADELRGTHHPGAQPVAAAVAGGGGRVASGGGRGGAGGGRGRGGRGGRAVRGGGRGARGGSSGRRRRRPRP